jgi:hypothetical protein
VQQRTQDAPHVRVVVDDEKTQAVEIDADHPASPAGRRSARPRAVEGKVLPLTLG